LESQEGLFSKAANIIVTGGSAGGLAAFLWADYIKSKASTPNVFSVPDSGIFLDFPTF
jgi:acetyl esterase/lipase